jgi:hypothetical protein
MYTVMTRWQSLLIGWHGLSQTLEPSDLSLGDADELAVRAPRHSEGARRHSPIRHLQFDRTENNVDWQLTQGRRHTSQHLLGYENPHPSVLWSKTSLYKIFMADGHTRYCVSVRGPHVESSNKCYSKQPELLCDFHSTSRDQDAGRSHSIKIDDSSFERVEQFKYFGTTLTDKNSILEEIKSRLKSGNACYHSVQILLSSRLLSKHTKIKICRTVIFPAVLYGCENWSLTLW